MLTSFFLHYHLHYYNCLSFLNVSLFTLYSFYLLFYFIIYALLPPVTTIQAHLNINSSIVSLHCFDVLTTGLHSYLYAGIRWTVD